MTYALAAGDVGTVVFYAEKQRLVPAIVAAREGSRHVLDNLIGERFAVVLNRLYWASSHRPLPDLATHWARVEALAATLDLPALEEAWDRLERVTPHRSGPPLITTPAAIAAHLPTCRGSDLATTLDAVIVAVFGNPIGFRIRDRVLFRESAQAVTEAREKRNAELAQKQLLAEAVAAFKDLLATPGASPSTSSAASPAFISYRDALLEVAALGREAPRFAFVQPLCEALGVHPDQSFELLVKVGLLEPDSNLAPIRAGIAIAFEPAVLAEAEQKLAYRPQPPIDLTHLYAVAIDDPETTEVDDAVALSGDHITVLIADASAYVPPGSALDRAAASRTSTIYLPEGKVPMVPDLLGEGPMSLNPGEPRSALAFSFSLAPDGALSGFDIQRARVTIARRLSYTEVDTLLASVPPTPAAPPVSDAPDADSGARHIPMLQRLERLMEKHRAWRHTRGAVTFQRPEIYYAVAPLAEGQTPGTRSVRMKVGDPLGRARQLIAELMVATCSGAATYCAERQIPCIYRTQAPPDDAPGKKTMEPAGKDLASRAINPTSGLVDDAALQYDLLRRMKPSVLTTSVGGHWTLAVPAYTQITSPIRRYADLLMHQQLSAFLKTGRPAFTAARLEGQLTELFRRQAMVRRVEQESRRFWALRYLEQNPGQELEGTVLREVGKKTLIELSPIAIHELIQLRRRRQPGQKLRFEVIEVSSRNDAITLKELG